jgi:hypothetical protein
MGMALLFGIGQRTPTVSLIAATSHDGNPLKPLGFLLLLAAFPIVTINHIPTIFNDTHNDYGNGSNIVYASYCAKIDATTATGFYSITPQRSCDLTDWFDATNNEKQSVSITLSNQTKFDFGWAIPIFGESNGFTRLKVNK